VTLELNAAEFVAFLLALIRAATWLTLAPPFNNRSIPAPVKMGLSAAMALAVAPHLAPSLGPGPFATTTLLGDGMVQAVTGASLGFFALLLFSAVSSAGSMIDVFGGFTISQAFDPFLNAQATVFGRLYEMVALVLLFVTDGHLILVRGFLTSFDAIGVKAPSLTHLGALVTTDLTVYMTAAVEIAAPLLGALFLAQVALGLLARATPNIHVFQISFPFTILLTLLLAGLALPSLPSAVSTLLGDVLRSGNALTH
jgi:flagellar biosynthetic protein FliR